MTARPRQRSPAPTIIVFTREPIAGITKTRLIPRLGSEGAAALAHAFTLDALSKARQLTDNLVIAGSAPEEVDRSAYFRKMARRFGAILIDQGSGSLGARMRRSLAPFLDYGALLIGSDTPSVPLDILARGVDLLRKFRVVLGPSLDGGYYAVGVRHVLPDIFRGIRWGRSDVLASTIARLEAGGTRYTLSDAWYDIDRWNDLILLAAQLRIDGAVSSNPCPATVRVLRRLGLLR